METKHYPLSDLFVVFREIQDCNCLIIFGQPMYYDENYGAYETASWRISITEELILEQGKLELIQEAKDYLLNYWKNCINTEKTLVLRMLPSFRIDEDFVTGNVHVTFLCRQVNEGFKGFIKPEGGAVVTIKEWRNGQS